MVIPAYNREKTIEITLVSIPDYVFRIYVIDDNSTERDARLTYGASRRKGFQDYVCLRHDKTKGMGASVTTGYREALKESMDITVVITGDHQVSAALLPLFLDPIIKRKADYTVGNRLQAPEYRKGLTTGRFFGNTSMNLFTKIASGYWQLSDPQNKSMHGDFKESS